MCNSPKHILLDCSSGQEKKTHYNINMEKIKTKHLLKGNITVSRLSPFK